MVCIDVDLDIRRVWKVERAQLVILVRVTSDRGMYRCRSRYKEGVES